MRRDQEDEYPNKEGGGIHSNGDVLLPSVHAVTFPFGVAAGWALPEKLHATLPMKGDSRELLLKNIVSGYFSSSSELRVLRVVSLDGSGQFCQGGSLLLIAV